MVVTVVISDDDGNLKLRITAVNLVIHGKIRYNTKYQPRTETVVY